MYVDIITSDLPEQAALSAEALLRQQGFRPGIAPHILARTVAVDAELCARRVCPDCGRRGLRYSPYVRKHGNRADYEYRIVASCPDCACSEEV